MNSGIILVILVTVAGFLEQLPKVISVLEGTWLRYALMAFFQCTLAAIIWVALLKLFMQIGNLPDLFRKSKTDFVSF